MLAPNASADCLAWGSTIGTRVDFRVEAKAHRIRAGVPRESALVSVGFYSPHALKRSGAHRGKTEAVLQEKLGPLPKRHYRLHAAQQVVLLDYFPCHVGGDAAEVNADLNHSVQFADRRSNVSRRQIAKTGLVGEIEETRLEGKRAHVAA